MGRKGASKKELPVFYPTVVEESNKELRNPERGWYQIVTYKLNEKFDPETVKYSLEGCDDSLVLLLVDIAYYKDKKITEEDLLRFEEVINFFAGNEMNVVLRVVYDSFGKCYENEPDNFSLILEHGAEILKAINKCKEHIFVCQGMLIGNWGEMHSSRYITPSQLVEMAKSFYGNIDTDVYCAVRTPRIWRLLYEEMMETMTVGLFDDAILGSETHLGTFALEEREEELDFEERICREVPQGGEVLYAETPSILRITNDAKLLAEYFARMHLTYLNRTYDTRLLDNLKHVYWEEDDIWKGMDAYSYVSRHLGYRFVVKSFECRPFEQSLKWTFEIENVGFARLYSKATVWLESEETHEMLDITEHLDLRRIAAGKSVKFSFRTPLLTGILRLGAAMEKNWVPIRFANRVRTGQLKEVYSQAINGSNADGAIALGYLK